MHEATLVAGLLRIVEEEARRHGAKRIVAVNLDVGLLACVEESTLRGCFELFAEGTMAENAALRVRIAPLACRCSDCGRTFSLTTRRFACPACGGEHINFEGGHGCTIASIEVQAEELSEPAEAARIERCSAAEDGGDARSADAAVTAVATNDSEGRAACAAGRHHERKKETTP